MIYRKGQQLDLITDEIISRYKSEIELKCRSHYQFLADAADKKKEIINNCQKLRQWVAEKYRSIQDPVFVKQAKSLQNSSLVSSCSNIDEACKKYSDDIECILNSKIPNWLSSVCYVFSHNWRKVVYEEIIKNYLYIEKYIDKEIEQAEERYQHSVSVRFNFDKQQLEKLIPKLLQEINQSIININKSILI